MRPIVPSRATYWLWFGWAAILTFGMLPYLLWALSRGLLEWAELWTAWGSLLSVGLFIFAVGVVFRWRWSKKKNALRAYEKMLASLQSSA